MGGEKRIIYYTREGVVNHMDKKIKKLNKMIEILNDIQSNTDSLIADDKIAEETYGKFSQLVSHLEYLEEKELREPEVWVHI